MADNQLMPILCRILRNIELWQMDGTLVSCAIKVHSCLTAEWCIYLPTTGWRCSASTPSASDVCIWQMDANLILALDLVETDIHLRPNWKHSIYTHHLHIKSLPLSSTTT